MRPGVPGSAKIAARPTSLSPSPAMNLADAGPPADRRRHSSAGNASSASSVEAKASGASASARSRSSRSASQSSARAGRTSV